MLRGRQSIAIALRKLQARTGYRNSEDQSVGMRESRTGLSLYISGLQYLQLRPLHSVRANGQFVPCVDGSELARTFFTPAGWSVQP
jgi:hypothetical protein